MDIKIIGKIKQLIKDIKNDIISEGKSRIVKVAIILSVFAFLNLIVIFPIVLYSFGKSFEDTSLEINGKLFSIASELIINEYVNCEMEDGDNNSNKKKKQYNSYAKLLSEAEKSYGRGKKIRCEELNRDDGSKEIDSSDIESDNYTYIGVFYAKLLDVDSDGIEEMIVAYRSWADNYIHIICYDDYDQQNWVYGIESYKIYHSGHKSGLHNLTISEINGKHYIAAISMNASMTSILYYPIILDLSDFGIYDDYFYQSDVLYGAFNNDARHTYECRYDSTEGRQIEYFDGVETKGDNFIDAITTKEVIHLDFDDEIISQGVSNPNELEVLNKTKQILGMNTDQSYDDYQSECKAYLEVIDNAEKEYGVSSLTNEKEGQLSPGVYFAELYDFDGDNTDELIYCYMNKESTKLVQCIVGYKGGEIVELEKREYSGQFEGVINRDSIFDASCYWGGIYCIDEDICFATVEKDEKGRCYVIYNKLSDKEFVPAHKMEIKMTNDENVKDDSDGITNEGVCEECGRKISDIDTIYDIYDIEYGEALLNQLQSTKQILEQAR